MSTDKISQAYSKINFRERPKQKTITAKEMGISIKGADTAKRKPSALQKMANGYKQNKERLEARTKEQEDKNKKDHEKALKTLKNNTKGADK